MTNDLLNLFGEQPPPKRNILMEHLFNAIGQPRSIIRLEHNYCRQRDGRRRKHRSTMLVINDKKYYVPQWLTTDVTAFVQMIRDIRQELKFKQTPLPSYFKDQDKTMKEIAAMAGYRCTGTRITRDRQSYYTAATAAVRFACLADSLQQLLGTPEHLLECELAALRQVKQAARRKQRITFEAALASQIAPITQ